MGAKKKKPAVPQRKRMAPDGSRSAAELTTEIVAQLERGGFVTTQQIARLAPRSPLRLEVFDQLIARGFEIGAKGARRPLDAQIEAALRDLGVMSVRALATHVRGATPRETRDACEALVDRQRARFLVRDGAVMLALASVPVLDIQSVTKLDGVLSRLLKDVRIASRKHVSMDRTLVQDALAPFARKPAASPSSAIADVAALVERNRETSGLTSVPKLVRLLGGAPARDAVHAELLRLARSGRYELRPESGMGRLSSEEAALCIPGPQGSRLSWVRRIEEGS